MYENIKKEKNIQNNWEYHIDIPVSKETQEELYRIAGFRNIKIEYDTNDTVMYVCKK